jgi:DNA-directed RNA polymerase specialized sigma24 family protein
LGDSARASEIVEEVAYSAAKAREQRKIKNPDSYLFSGVVRKVRRLLEKDSRVEYIGSSTELAGLETTRDDESPARLEKHILANEVMDLVNEHERDILLRWSRGDEWDEIAEDLGTTVNGAQCRLCRALEKARERVLGSKNRKSKLLP